MIKFAGLDDYAGLHFQRNFGTPGKHTPKSKWPGLEQGVKAPLSRAGRGARANRFGTYGSRPSTHPATKIAETNVDLGPGARCARGWRGLRCT